MAVALSTRDPGFAGAFAALLAQKRETSADVDGAVAAIVDDVATRGDAALIEYTDRFNRVRLTPETLRLSQAERDVEAPAEAIAALRFAAGRIEAFHKKQLPA